jgi:hypothetical protein
MATTEADQHGKQDEDRVPILVAMTRIRARSSPRLQANLEPANRDDEGSRATSRPSRFGLKRA